MRTRVVAVILIAASFALASCPWDATAQGVVPNFELKTIDGESFVLADQLARGPVLIDFWATWCKPCLRELPHLDAIRAKYEKDGLVVVAISTDETRTLSKVKSYVKTHGFGFPVLLDTNLDVFRKLGGRGMPYVLLVSPQRERLYAHTGYRDGDERRLEARVAEVMADFRKPGSGNGPDDAGGSR